MTEEQEKDPQPAPQAEDPDEKTGEDVGGPAMPQGNEPPRGGQVPASAHEGEEEKSK